MIGRRALLAGAGLLVPGCARAQTSGVEIQGELHHGLIFAQARLNGRAGPSIGWFLIDTGAPLTLVDAAFAARAGVRLKGRETLRGLGGVQPARRGEATPFTFAGEPATILRPSVIDLSGVGRRMGVAMAGVVGGDLLSNHVLTLDYRSGRVSLGAPGSIAAPAHAFPMRVGRTPYIRAVAVLGERRSEAEFQIDTGANTAVVLWRRFAARAFPDAQVSPGAAAGVGGVGRTLMGRLDALQIGPSTVLRGLTTNFADETQPDDAGRDYGGVIGGPAWTDRTVTVDYPAGRFWVS